MHKGQRVRVFLPQKELTITPILRQFNGKETRVSEIHVYPNCGERKTYHLQDCVSDFAIPFEFFEEWLIPLDEEGGGNDG